VIDPDPLEALLAGLAGAAALGGVFWPRAGLWDRWGRLRRHSARVLREDALKHILQAEGRGAGATIESVAGALGISSDRAATLLEEMDRADLVEAGLDAGGGSIRLSPAGRRTALHVVRAHRLWERHLADETGYAEAEWHPRADVLEHEITPEEADRLDARLNHPTHDPHGDPIPAADSGPLLPPGRPLAGLPAGAAGRIVHIEDEPETVYAQIVAQGLAPGTILRVLETTPRRIRFWAGEEEHVLAPIVAANVSVAPFEPGRDAAEAEPEAFGEGLHALRPGERARVVRISPRCRGAERRRLLDLGVVPGTEIAAEIVSPTGDPTAYRVRGALIALRRSQAEMIRVEIDRLGAAGAAA
jgi:DtxR family Mn-dependent transcriptional regulator